MAYPTAPSPSPGPELSEREEPERWAELTERIELPQSTQKFAGFGESQVLTLERVGCAAEALVAIELKFTTPAKGTAEVKPNIGAPWNMLKRVALQANGVAGIISCSAMVLKARELVEYRSPPDTQTTSLTPGSALTESAEQTWFFIINVPIAEDLRELDGIILAQSEETALGIELTWATEGEVFESGATHLTLISGTIRWHMTLFSIGTATEGKKTIVVLPDLQSLHGLVERSQVLVNEGEQEAPLTRTSGDLLRYFASAWNGAKKQFNPTSWNNFYLQYGGNQKPIFYAYPKFLVYRNEQDYLGRPTVNGVYFVVVDTQLDDALRDAIRPMALSELKAVIGIPSTPEANSTIRTAQETLYPANA